jgi:hypothetical protein
MGDEGVRRHDNRLKSLLDRLAYWLGPGSEHHLAEDLSIDFGFFVRDVLPCKILLWWPREISGLEEVQRTGFGTAMGRESSDLAADRT